MTARRIGLVVLAIAIGRAAAVAQSCGPIDPFSPFSRPTYDLARDPGKPSRLFAATGLDIYRSENDGQSWSKASGDLTNFNGFRLAFAANDVVLLEVGPYLGDDVAIFRTVNFGGHWDPIRLSEVEPQHYSGALYVDPRDRRTVYAGVIGTDDSPRLFRSRDAGATFDRVRQPQPSNVYSVAVEPASGTLYAGAYKSLDDGATWIPLGLLSRHGLTDHEDRPGGEFALDPDSSSVLFDLEPSQDQYHSAFSTVWRSIDSGATFVGLASLPYFTGRGKAFAWSPLGSLYAATGFGLYVSTDRGWTWTNVAGVPPNAHSVSPGDGSTVLVGTDSGLCRVADRPADCPPGAGLCFQRGRFRAAVQLGAGGEGHSVSLTPDTGAFWFFSENNLELVVKVVDGRDFNGKFWVFCGQLTDVEYTLTITDTVTGAVWRHHNPPGTLSSVADAAAF
jgi:hypothetical protein